MVSCSLIEVKAVDLSLASRQEKNNFFFDLKSLYQIKGLNLKCYKIDEKINLNNNKIKLEELIEKFKDDKEKKELLKESKDLIEYLETNDFTVSSIYYWVVISKNVEELEKQLEEIEIVTSNMTPRLNITIIQNRLEIYKFLCNIYLSSNLRLISQNILRYIYY